MLNKKYLRIALAAALLAALICLPTAMAFELSSGAAWDQRYGEGEKPGDYMGTWTIAFCDNWVSMYAKPSAQSECLAQIPKWADVEAYYYNSDWFECNYLGLRGYISRDYLTDRPGKFPDYPGNR